MAVLLPRRSPLPADRSRVHGGGPPPPPRRTSAASHPRGRPHGALIYAAVPRPHPQGQTSGRASFRLPSLPPAFWRPLVIAMTVPPVPSIPFLNRTSYRKSCAMVAHMATQNAVLALLSPPSFEDDAAGWDDRSGLWIVLCCVTVLICNTQHITQKRYFVGPRISDTIQKVFCRTR